MLGQLCEECFNKFSCIAYLDCYRSSSKFRPPPIQGNLPIQEYFKLFETFILGSGISKDHLGLKMIFINGLSDENKEEVRELPFGAIRLIENIVAYLASVEDFKRTILRAGEYKHN